MTLSAGDAEETYYFTIEIGFSDSFLDDDLYGLDLDSDYDYDYNYDYDILIDDIYFDYDDYSYYDYSLDDYQYDDYSYIDYGCALEDLECGLIDDFYSSSFSYD